MLAVQRCFPYWNDFQGDERKSPFGAFRSIRVLRERREFPLELRNGQVRFFRRVLDSQFYIFDKINQRSDRSLFNSVFNAIFKSPLEVGARLFFGEYPAQSNHIALHIRIASAKRFKIRLFRERLSSIRQRAPEEY